MNLKTFLLGTGAAFAVVTGAQAADLAVAEPVDYVKVCDAAGVGYWYIPGTDTCLKIGGNVREDINFHDDALIAPGHTGNFNFVTETYLTATAKSLTDYGWLTGYIAWEGDYKANGSSSDVYVDEAFLSLGPLLAGKTASTYDYGGGFTWDGSDLDADNSHSQVRLSWAANGYGVLFGVEDPRGTWGTAAGDDVFVGGVLDHYDIKIPDLVAAVTASQGPWDAKVSFGYADLNSAHGDNGWGVQAGAKVKLDQIAQGDALLLKGAYAKNAYGFAADGNDQGPGAYWSALGSFQHFFTPQVYAAATFDYLDGPVFNRWQATGQLTWLPAHNFQVGPEVTFSHSDAYGITAKSDTWAGKLRLQRDFGG